MLLTLMVYCLSGLIVNIHPEKLDLLSNVDMYEVGLAKINQDDNYDIYTVNHVFAETFFFYDSGKFTQTNNEIPTSVIQTPAYEPVGTTPTHKKGINIYSPNRLMLHIYCHQCESNTQGTLKIPIPSGNSDSVLIEYQENAQATKTLGPTADFIDINFNINDSGLLVFKTWYPDLRFEFNFQSSSEQIFIGQNNVSQKNNEFTINSLDNHSMSWAKVNEDKFSDVFMGTGGLRGQIAKFNPKDVLQENLYLYNPETKSFFNIASDANLKKGDCRTYQSTWIDYENDGDLDLYLGCKLSKNKLYIQQGLGSGTFIESANQYHLDFIQGDEYHWSDLNKDGLLDFMIIAQNMLHVYLRTPVQSKHVYKRIYSSKILGEKLDSIIANIQTLDLDNSGFVEIYISIYNPHIMTHDTRGFYAFDFNQAGSIFSVDTDKKYPGAEGHISFTDINFDGLQDMISLERNVLIQHPGLIFKENKELDHLFNDKHNNFRNIIWFDPELNGHWNVLVAESHRTKTKVKKKLLNYVYKEIEPWDKLTHYKDLLSNQNNWLYIDLMGSTYNQDGIGAKIYVKSSEFTQYRELMGNHDTFRSQGHYRQYIGLGQHKQVSVEVIWPDGKQTIIENVQSNQLLKVKHPSLDN